MGSGYNVNVVFLRRFCRLHSIFFPGVLSLTTGVLGLLLLTSALEQFLAYKVGIMAGQFFNALGSKDLAEFKTICIQNILLIVGISLTKSARVLSARILTVGWRQTLCQTLHRLYMSNTNYYRMNVLDGTVDNPDQRITSDVSSLVESYGSIINKLVVIPFTIAYYTWDAYTRAGWLGPTGMFGLFLVSTVINKVLMKPVVQITVEKERKEGDFRFKHMQVRSNAESLAFYGSAGFELAKVNDKLSEVCGAQQKLYNRNFIIDISVNIFSYLGAIASYLVIAVPIFSGAYDSLTGPELSQKISENAFVCIYLVFQLTELVTITGTVASLAGSTHRVCELIEQLIMYEKKSTSATDQELKTTKPIPTTTNDVADPDDEPIISVVVDSPVSTVEDRAPLADDVLIEFCGFGLSPPTEQSSADQILIQNLNLQITRGRSLLVMGPSSSGKSSLLRTIRGLWAPDQGTVLLNRSLSHGYFYLPQKPFFTNGTLREQINYPLLVCLESVDREEEENILNLLELTDLAGLLDRCGGLDHEPSWSWFDVLSPGEQQRLAFVRLLFHKPVLAVMDEATSAVSQDIESRLYNICIQRKITLLSVGHRNSLKQFHQQVLYLTGVEGGWRIEDLPIQDNLAPGQDNLVPGQDNLAPGQDNLAPGQDNPAPRQVPL